VATAQPPGDGCSLTLGQAIDLYWPQVATAGYSRNQQTLHHAALTKRLPWTIFRQMPCELWSSAVETMAIASIAEQTARKRLAHYLAFSAFTWDKPVRYLTFGTAVDAFLEQAEPGKAGSSQAGLRSDLRALGREIARRQRLRAIPAQWWQTVCEALPDGHRRSVLRFLRWLRDRQWLSVTVVPPPPTPFWRRDIAERIRLAPARLTPETGWQPALGAYLRHQRDALGVQEESLRHTWQHVRRFGRWLDAHHFALVGLDEAIALRYLAEEEHRGIGYASLRAVAGALRGLSGFLAQQGVLRDDPLSGLRIKPRDWPGPTTAPDEDQMRTLVAVVRSRLEEALQHPATTRGPQQQLILLYRDVALVEVLCGTGLRSSELCRLKVADLDTTRGRLRVRGKGSHRHSVRERILDLPDPGLRSALADYLNARQPELDEPLFASATGHALQHAGVDQILQRYRERAGLSRINPRDLRHGFASALVARGVDPLTLQVVMGHGSLTTTLRHYVALNEQELRQVWLRTNPLSRLPAHQQGGDPDRDPRPGS
jgi:integrase/recombinase XerC